MLNHQLVTLGQFIELAQPIINIGLVPLAVGQAGAGKTESGYKIAEIMGYDYVLRSTQILWRLQIFMVHLHMRNVRRPKPM